MNKKYCKITLLFSLIIGCFIGMSNNSYKRQDSDLLVASAKMDYSNYNFDMDTSNSHLPSELVYIDSNGDEDHVGKFESDGRLNMNQGGSSTFASSAKQPYGKRNIKFTLYEDVKMEIVFDIGSSSAKTFQIYTNGAFLSDAEVTVPKTSQEGPLIYVYEFKNVPSSGQVFQMAGSSSNITCRSITFGIGDRARFNANGGKFSDGSSEIAIDRPEGGSETVTTPPEDPTYVEYDSDNKIKTEKVFGGWSTTKNGAVDSWVTNLEYNKTYYAIWVNKSSIIWYLDPIYSALQYDESITITASILSPVGLKTPKIDWKSSDNDIASVEDGVVTAHQTNGTVTITASISGVSDLSTACTIKVSKNTRFTVNFFESFEVMCDYFDESTETGEVYSKIEVFDGDSINNVPVFGTGKGYTITWMDDNGTPTNKGDDKVFDLTKGITKDLNVYAEIVIVPVATEVEIVVPEENAIKTIERTYYIQPNTSITLSVELSRDDGRFAEIENNAEFKKNKGDISWYSTDESIATVDKKTGVVKMLKSGKAEIYARVYENTANYSQHIITASSIVVSCLGDKIIDNKTIDTSLGLKCETGRFDTISEDKEKAVRFIGYLSEDFFPYITEAKFKVEAINEDNVVQKTFEYDVTTFSRVIDYTSKTPSKGYFKPWEAEGKLGAAFTITGLPTNEFIGKFKATFMVTDGETSIVVPCVGTVTYRGV